MKILKTLSLCLAASLTSIHAAEACSCMESPSAMAAYNASNVVITGRVSNIRNIYAQGSPTTPLRLRVTIQVYRTLKGGFSGHRRYIYTAPHSAMCGYPFEVGRAYLIYAYRNTEGGPPRLSTNLCSRTKPLSEAGPDLTEIAGSPHEAELMMSPLDD